MYLTLEVTSANAATLGSARRGVFSVDGGRIGRAIDSDMVLPGAGVHRHHATVRFINGVFFIEGVGTNGIAVNNAEAILPRNEPYPLKQGDTLYIDEFEISVAVSAAAPPAPQAAAPVHRDQPVERAPLIDAPLESAADLDPLKRLDARSGARPQAASAPQAAWNHSSALSDHFAPAAVPTSGPTSGSGPGAVSLDAIPEDWDKTSFNRAKLQPMPAAPPVHSPVRAPVRQAAPPVPAPGSEPGAALDWNGFLRSAGVDPATVPADTSAVLGNIVRTVVQGLIEVLRARSEIKTEFRMPVTQVKVSENNPLKFAANAEDALGNLFGRRNPAYLPPQDAFEDAFDDVRFHQLAMLVGVRAGFDHLMSRFDPEQLEENFARQGRRGLFGGGKAQYWELYGERFREMAADADETFRRLFGEEFARAYERQLAALKSARSRR